MLPSLFFASATEREARLLRMVPPEGPSQEPAPQTQEGVEHEVAQRTQQETNDDPFRDPDQAPERVQNTRRQTRERLSPSLRHQLRSFEQQKIVLDTQIRELDRRLRDFGRSHRGNYRRGSAIHPRYGGGRGPAPFEYGLRMQNDAQMMLQTQRDLQALRLQRYNVQKQIDTIRGWERAGLGNPHIPDAPADLQQNPEIFGGGPPDNTSFDLEGRLKNVDPEAAELVRASPSRAQETVIHFLESLDPQDQEAAETMLQKVNVNALNMSVLAKHYAATGGLEVTSDLDPAAAAVLQSLTPQEKTLLKKLFDSGATLRTGTGPEQAAEVDRAQIEKYVERWQKAKTEADRTIAEGMLLLNGVDTDASDLDKGKIVTLPPEMRFGGIIAGIFKLVIGILEKLGKKSPKIATESASPEVAPENMTPEQREEAISHLNTSLNAMKQEETGLLDRIKTLETQRNASPPPEEEELARIDKELTQARADLKAVQETIRKQEAAIAAINVATGEPEESAPQNTPPSQPFRIRRPGEPEQEDVDPNNGPPGAQFSIPPEPRQPVVEEVSEEGSESEEEVTLTPEQVEAVTVQMDQLDQRRNTAEEAEDGTPAKMKDTIDAIQAELAFVDDNPGLVALGLVNPEEVDELRARGLAKVEEYNTLVEQLGAEEGADKEAVVGKLREYLDDTDMRSQMVISRERSVVENMKQGREDSGWFGGLSRFVTLSDPYQIEMNAASQKAATMEHVRGEFLPIVREELSKPPDEVNVSRVIDALNRVKRVIATANKVDLENEHWQIEEEAINVTRNLSIAVITAPAAFIGGPATATVGGAMKFGAITGARIGFMQSATRNVDDVRSGQKTAMEGVRDTVVDTARDATIGAATGGLFKVGGNTLSRLRLRRSNLPPPQPQVRPQTGPNPQSGPQPGPQTKYRSQPSQQQQAGPRTAGPRPGPQTGPNPQSGPQTGPRPGPQTGPRPGPQRGPNPQSGPRSGPRTGPKPGSEPNPQGGPRNSRTNPDAPEPTSGPQRGPAPMEGFNPVDEIASGSMKIRDFVGLTDDFSVESLRSAAKKLMTRLHTDTMGESATAASEANLRFVSSIINIIRRNPERLRPYTTIDDLNRML